MTTAVVGTSVPEQLIAAIFDALLLIDPTINCFLGRRATEDYSAPHSIVAIPLGAPSIDDHGLKPGGSPWGSNGGRQLMIRHFNIEWRCHDGPAAPDLIPDFTNTEALYVATLVALRTALSPTGEPFHNGIHFSSEEWIDQQEGEDGYERSGTVIKFISTLDLPVYDLPPTLVSLTATPKILTTVTELDQTVTINES